MMAMLCNIWDDFCKWVTVDWSQTTYMIVVCTLGALALIGLLSFLKGSNKKDKKPLLWGKIFVCLLLLGVLAVIVAAKYA